MQIHNKRVLITIAGLALIALSGCSASTDVSSSEENESTTSETTTPMAVEETTTSASPITTVPAALATVATAPVVLMPDVVCMNLQAAQDEIQKYGVFFSRSSDATGMDRSQLIDRNWIVVKQTPLPGQPVTELEAVLSVVKIGESTGGVC